MNDRVLFFSPHAGIWVHAFPEALVADAVRQAGAEVVYVTCDGAFASFCVTMSAAGLTQESPVAAKAKVCAGCRRNRDWLRYGLRLPGYDLESLLNPDDELRVASLAASVSPDTLATFEVDGVKVGRAALYEYLLHNKRSQSGFAASEWAAFLPRLQNVLRSFFAAQRAFRRERPTRLVVYNSLYSVNAVWRALADREGVPVIFLHAGLSLSNRLQRLMVGRDSTLRWLERVVASWPAFAPIPARPDQLAAVTDHFIELLRGTNVFAYSATKAADAPDLRARFGVRPDQTLLVATMSSYDEYVAAQTIGEMPDARGVLFPTQIDWIRALVAWIRDRPDRFLLIRVHPREFPNKREGRKSDHAALLERELSALPPNAAVNWPADGVSLYDIAEHAAVFLNAWSSVGKEMSLLGLPVVVYCPTLLQYPAALNYVGTTRATYFDAIEQALREGWSFDRIRATYRWCALEYVRAIVDIGDGFDYSEVPPTGLLQRLRNLALNAPALRPARDLWRRPATLRAQQRIADAVLGDEPTPLGTAPAANAADERIETGALRHELRRLTDALYARAGGEAPGGSLRARLLAAST